MVDLYQCNHTDPLMEIAKATPFTKFDSKVNFVLDHQATSKYGRKMYRVLESFRYYVGKREDNKWVYVPAGFLTDLATVPKAFEWLIPHDGPYAKAAIVHDILCEQATVFINGEPTYVSFNEAHRIFDEAMWVLGVHRLVRYLLIAAVRLYFWYNGYEVPKSLIGKTNDAFEYQERKKKWEA